MTVRSRICALATIGLLLAAGSASQAATQYVLDLGLTEFEGDSLVLAFALISPNATGNSAMISDLVHDGRTRIPVLATGGPVSGELLVSGVPASATIRDDLFHNGIDVPLDTVGTFCRATIVLTEAPAPGGTIPDELAFTILNPAGEVPFPVVDPFGTRTLFTIDVTGQSGGELSVFAPMQFVAPDTLRMSNSTTAVLDEPRTEDRLRLIRTAPNPFSGSVRVDFAVPAPGGTVRVRIYDVLGRVVAEPLCEHHAAGPWSVSWNGRTRAGKLAPAGAYLLELRLGGQTVVRRVVLAR